ncbi:MAG: DNA polymerase III subunit gamma/tau [Chloroflexi bacterium]|nr:DNA polymerase III subunit gamma/tau [Chloroflexota bacterium]
MSEVFYRKWRPKLLADVVGQEPVTKTLRQAVSQGRVAHAYLFCGSRGTGKTSTARILAKAVNCLSPVDGEPDNQCSICQSINEGRALDLIEIDAASNRGIDDIRNLSDKIRFTPNEARYKVYIIDEVHMLTEPAFNALLKTLEEPPSHAIFILATTEVHKVPLTIISRCQRFDFRRIPMDGMMGKLATIAKEEGVEVSTDALRLIARNSNGGLRDAENLLEQVVVSYDPPVTEDNVRDLLGLSGDETALDLVEHIIGRAIGDGISAINQVYRQGNDLRQLHRGVVEYLRAVLLLKTKAGTDLGYAEDVLSRLESLTGEAELGHLVASLKLFASADLRRDSSSPLPLELAMVESASGPASAPPAQASQQPPQRAAAAAPPRPHAAPPRSVPPGQPAASGPRPEVVVPPVSHPPAQATEPAFANVNEAPSEPTARLDYQWRDITRSLRHVGAKFKLGALLNVCKEREVVDGTIVLKFTHKSNMERMQQELENPECRKAFNEVMSEAMDKPYEVRLTVVNGGGGSAMGASQKSPLVRAAQSMGARVLAEKEEEKA